MKNFIKDNKPILIVIAKAVSLFSVLDVLTIRCNIGILGQFLIATLVVLWSVLDALEYRG